MSLKTNIIFLYADSLRRDFSACYILKQKLQEKGFSAIICSRRNFNFFLKFLTPRKIFIIGQLDMIYKTQIINESLKGNIEVHFMPAEGFAYDTEYDVMYPSNYNYNFLDTIFFWGEYPKNWFILNRNIEDETKLVRSGYTRLPIAKSYLSVVNSSKNKIGFIGRFPALNDIYNRSTLSFYLLELNKEERNKVLSRVDAESKAIKLYLDIFDEIIENTKYIISLRPHPNEDINSYSILEKKYGERFEVNNDFDVAEWMSSCSKIIGLASSSFIDANTVNTPVICLDEILNTSKSTLHFDPALVRMYECCYLPKEKDEILKYIQDENLLPFSQPSFQELLNSSFVGETELVFDTILSRLLFKPINRFIFWDFIILRVLYILDLLFSTISYLKGTNSLKFDYSIVYHKLSSNLRIMGADIKSKLV